MKQINKFLLLILLFVAGIASAEQPMLAELELYPLRIKISDDGTGIIKNMTCGGCDYNIGKITLYKIL